MCTIQIIKKSYNLVKGVKLMDKLKLVIKSKSKDSVARTIRMSGTTFDKITEIADKKAISFNNVVNQLIEYSLSNLDEEN